MLYSVTDMFFFYKKIKTVLCEYFINLKFKKLRIFMKPNNVW